MSDLVLRRIIQRPEGRIEVMSLEYKTMSVFSYWAYTKSGHLVGYSKDLSAIEKRLTKAYKKGR